MAGAHYDSELSTFEGSENTWRIWRSAGTQSRQAGRQQPYLALSSFDVIS